MLKLASFFHLNLMYSSIGKEARTEVIERCYHPLLDLASPQQPVTLEATGLTLEMIAELDNGWVEKLNAKRQTGAVQFVGSGYSQIIGPLVPGEVNQANLQHGRLVYENLLGENPNIWLINEMAYSGGLPQLYAEVGAKALVMEWNNTWKGHPEWNPELRYHHQQAVGCDGTTLPVLWIDTIDFQKYQRMATDGMEPGEWVRHWQTRAESSQGMTRFAALYGSDAEVFDFRPGRYSQEGYSRPTGEWERIRKAMVELGQCADVEFVTLGAALEEKTGDVCGQPLRLECTRQPVVVKKQEKYNLNRWAVTGRGDLEANTACFATAHYLAQSLDKNATAAQWRDLLWRWSSDFRTHIEDGRWQEYRKTITEGTSSAPATGTPLEVDTPVRHLDLATPTTQASLDLKRGLTLRSVVFPVLGQAPAIGTLPHGHFDDIAFGADFYSGHAVVQYPGQRKLTDLQACAGATQLVRHDDGSITASTRISDDGLQVHKTVTLLADKPAVVLSGQLELPDRRPGEIHPVHLTVVPGLFDMSRLEFRTHNGGLTEEKFSLAETEVHHGESYSTLVTAKGGLGATNGVVILGDGKRSLVVSHDPTVSALMPTIRFEKVRGGGYFWRLRYSAQETDETFVSHDNNWQVRWHITIEAREQE